MVCITAIITQNPVGPCGWTGRLCIHNTALSPPVKTAVDKKLELNMAYICSKIYAAQHRGGYLNYFSTEK